MRPAVTDRSDPDLFELDLDVMVESALPSGVDPVALDRLIRFVLAAEGSRGRWTVAVVLAGDERLQTLHRDFMGLDSPTDVITFPLGDEAGSADADRGGDIAVSVERAASQAGAFGQTAGEEVLFLVVHGLLHLCGWVDASDTDRDRMLERQSELIARFGAA